MMQVIFVLIEYNILHFLAVIQFKREKSLITDPIFSVFGKFFAWELFVVIEHLRYYALNHGKSIPQGVATKRNNLCHETL
jgi:hypothetical protein